MTKTSSTFQPIPEFDLALFEYNKNKQTLQINRAITGTPQQFRVRSRTGRIVTFAVDHDDMMANEHYDGEACSYRPLESCNVLRAFVVSW